MSTRPNTAESASISWAQHLQAFVNYLRAECGLSENTVAAYSRDLRSFFDELENRSATHPREVTPLLVRGFLITLSNRKLALSSIARHLVSVRMFLRFAFIIRLTDQDIGALLETPKKWQTLPHTLRQKEVEDILAAPQSTDPFYARDRAILEMLYATGMRVSEVSNLRISDVNLTVGYVRCFGKGGKERVVPLGSMAIETVGRYVKGQRAAQARGAETDALFLSRTGAAIDRTNIWRLVSRYAALAGITEPVGPHTLRHCFASHMLEGGADLRIVQELLGHTDVATTQIYTHVDKRRLKSIHQKFHPRQ